MQADDAPDGGGGDTPALTAVRRRIGVRIFSSASDAPRARRPTDAALVILTVVVVALLAIPAPGPTRLDTAIDNLIGALPGLFGWFWEIGYDLLIVWALALIGIALFAHRRKGLLRDLLFSGALAFVLSLFVGRLAGTDWSKSLDAMTASHGPAVYMAVRLCIATAVIVTASPHMTHALRLVGRGVLLVGAISVIALGVSFPIGVIAGFVVGVGSAALVHLIVGSPGGRLTLDQMAAALDEIGIEVSDLRNAPFEPSGVALATGSASDGRPLLVKVYGRDAWEGQLLSSTWTALWRRGARPQLGSGGRLQLVEHEAFVTLLAERAGVPVMPIVGAGMADEGDALLVSEVTGRSFDSLDPDEIDDALLRAIWDVSSRLHELGVAHGQLDGTRIVVRSDGTPALADLGQAKVAATRVPLLSDQAQILVAMALRIGDRRAIEATVAAIGNDGLAEILPFLQPAVFDRATLRAVKEQDWSLGDLSDRAAAFAGIVPPKLERIRRVTVRSFLLAAAIALFAYWFIASLAGIDINDVVNELKSADKIWLWAALILTPAVQLPQAFSTIGASREAVRYGPVLMLQYAIQFIQLAVPSSAARVALEIRFFQRMGIEVGGATSIGIIDGVSGFVVQSVMILVIMLSGLASLTLPSATTTSSTSRSSSSGSSFSLWMLLVALLVIGAILGLAIPRYRKIIKEAVPRYRTMIRDQASEAAVALRVLRDPKKLAMLFGGNFVGQVMLAIILGLCLKAFGYSATLAELILVNTLVSMFAGFMPVPGGMGVAEAGFTAGLQAIGVPSAAAMSTAIAFRLVTFYIPPLWGGFAMRWLRRHDYV
ncbi:MAG: lysylphosphatidylglycerol synthase domain-containing protein [Actinomycetota bacterium]